jgi:hypothetical protein
MKEILTLLFSVLCLSQHTISQKGKRSFNLKENAIYLVQKNVKKTKIKIGFINSNDSSKFTVVRKILKNGKLIYIKIGNAFYYLNSDVAPLLSSDICDELKRIEPDTAIRYGEPLRKSVIAALMINSKGEIQTYGFARGANDSYYESATLKVLKQYSNSVIVPARIKDMPVCYLLMLSFIFHEGKCLIVSS